jgi:hypothetical protein
MAVKTFTTGEVLTAADTNTYLANAGLDYVKSQTIGSAVSTVTVSSAFASTWNAYRIVLNNVTMSSNTSGTTMWLKMHDGTNPVSSNYVYAFTRIDIAAATSAAITANLGINGIFIGRGTGDKFGTSVDVLMPNLATHTLFPDLSGLNVSTGYIYKGAGMHQSSTAYTAFQIYPDSGTLTGGTITVYGYRLA